MDNLIILDKPYVSDFLKQTIVDHQLTVIGTENLNTFNLPSASQVIEQETAIELLCRIPHASLYTNSENALSFVLENFRETERGQTIEQFKNKVKFRQLLQEHFPALHYQAVPYQDLKTMDIASWTTPFVLKPSAGFFSLGVYLILSQADWDNAMQSLDEDIRTAQLLYPRTVINTDTFILEDFIEGEEFAFDAYYNLDGKPVILNIFKHFFSSKTDVRDRVYTTSKAIMTQYIQPFTDFLTLLGKCTPLKNFPLHVEVRVNTNGELTPVEINPLRFGGWCTTADLTPYAYDINPYLCYFNHEVPNWTEKLDNMNDDAYSFVILDKAQLELKNKKIQLNWEALLKKFSSPLSFRPVEHQEHPLFGFLFVKTSPHQVNELEYILKSDLTEFIMPKLAGSPNEP